MDVLIKSRSILTRLNYSIVNIYDVNKLLINIKLDFSSYYYILTYITYDIHFKVK